MQVISVNNNYASGLKRLAAYIVDYLLLSVLFSIFIWRWWWGPLYFYDYHGGIFNFSLHLFKDSITGEILWVIYFALMESSRYQGTLGKIILGIKVVDRNNHRINFGTAVLRNLSKILSALILFIGYIMIIFDERKQGLHDKIADTFVVES